MYTFFYRNVILKREKFLMYEDFSRVILVWIISMIYTNSDTLKYLVNNCFSSVNLSFFQQKKIQKLHPMPVLLENEENLRNLLHIFTYFASDVKK